MNMQEKEAAVSSGPGDSRPTVSVLAWLRLARVYQRIDQLSADSLRKWALSTAQFDLLVQVGIAEGCTQQELATALLVTKGNICQLVDRMERDGLISRVPSGRSNKLYLTESGRSLFSEVVPAQESAIEGMFSSLGDDEQEQLLRLLRRLDRRLAVSKVEDTKHDD